MADSTCGNKMAKYFSLVTPSDSRVVLHFKLLMEACDQQLLLKLPVLLKTKAKNSLTQYSIRNQYFPYLDLRSSTAFRSFLLMQESLQLVLELRSLTSQTVIKAILISYSIIIMHFTKLRQEPIHLFKFYFWKVQFIGKQALFVTLLEITTDYCS